MRIRASLSVLTLFFLGGCFSLFPLGRKKITCKDFKEIQIRFSQLPKPVRSKLIALKSLFADEEQLDSVGFEERIDIVATDGVDSIIEVTVVINDILPNSQRAPKNRNLLKQGGYYFEYMNRKYYMKCGNITNPKVIYDGKMFYTKNHRFYDAYSQELSDYIFSEVRL